MPAYWMGVPLLMCDHIAVMSVGKLVEIAESEELLTHPRYPYTEERHWLMIDRLHEATL